MADEEKNAGSGSESVRSVELTNAQREFYEDDVLHEPPRDETLHRGLKARQISMIAVRISKYNLEPLYP